MVDAFTTCVWDTRYLYVRAKHLLGHIPKVPPLTAKLFAKYVYCRYMFIEAILLIRLFLYDYNF